MLTPLRKIAWALLLPVLLLFAQQGELLHEVAHAEERAVAAAACKNSPADTDQCLQCLAYAQMAGAVTTDVFPPQLLAGLRFDFAPSFAVASVDSDAASPRSRGPPSA